MILTNCNCPIKVVNDWGTLSFDYYNSDTTSVLEVGELISSLEIEIQEYVIDWYLNNEKVLTTGVGDDPNIQAFHPFTGEAAIPVVGGSYTPVIRYIMVDDERIWSVPKPCQKWTNFIVDFPSIIISRLNCQSGNTGSNYVYQYTITYVSTDPTSLPSRTIAIDLPDDLSAEWFSFQFTGYDIGDRVEIFFSDGTLLTSWDLGGDVGREINNMPYSYLTVSAFSFVASVPEYQIGDYLIVKITPAVVAHIPQTNWSLSYKCLLPSADPSFGSAYLFRGDMIKESMRAYDITEWSFVNNADKCRREFYMRLEEPLLNFRNANNPYYSLYRYGRINTTIHSSGLTDKVFDEIPYMGCYLGYTSSATSESFNTAGGSGTYVTYGSVNLTKSGSNYTYTFTDSRDWQVVKDMYDLSKTSGWWTNRSESDTSDIKYYRWWTWSWRVRPANCGDTQSPLRSIYAHHKSTISFGANTITIVPYYIADYLEEEPCNLLYTNINNLIRSSNSAIDSADFNEDSLCMEQAPFSYGRGYLGNVHNVSNNSNGGYSITSAGGASPCEIGVMCKTANNITWYWYHFMIRVIIDLEKDSETGDFPKNSNGDYILDPCKNFHVDYRLIKEDGCLGDYVKILEVVENEYGVAEVVYSLPYENLYD